MKELYKVQELEIKIKSINENYGINEKVDKIFDILKHTKRIFGVNMTSDAKIRRLIIFFG